MFFEVRTVSSKTQLDDGEEQCDAAEGQQDAVILVHSVHRCSV